jgi:hypothetical protein
MEPSRRDIHRTIRKFFRLRNKALRTLPYCASFRYPRKYLANVFAEAGFNVGAEIGVRRANYSKVLCMANPNLKLYCIDPWDVIGTKYPKEKQDRYFGVTKKRLAPYDHVIIRKKSIDAVGEFPDGFFDFVYIDGDHSFEVCMLDIIHYSPKVKSGGIMAVHDYYGGEKGVFNAVNAYIDSNNITPWYVTKELAPTAFWVKP